MTEKPMSVSDMNIDDQTDDQEWGLLFDCIRLFLTTLYAINWSSCLVVCYASKIHFTRTTIYLGYLSQLQAKTFRW